MKKTVLLVLLFVAAGAFLIYKLFLMLGGSPNFQTELNRNRDIADPDLMVFNISAKGCEFSPNMISVRAGDRVKIFVRSFDAAYGFSLPEYRINEIIESQKQVTIDFLADMPGEFEFTSEVYCTASSKPNMAKGVLRVE
jgi:hypothetical protein